MISNTITHKQVFFPQQKLNNQKRICLQSSMGMDTFIKNQKISFSSNEGINFYDSNAVDFFNTTKGLKNMQPTCDIFTDCLPEKATILDAGCGSGRDSKYFIEQGFKVTSIDGSKELCKLASKFIGQEVLNLEYSQIPPHPKYDGIWACAAFVHVKDNKELHENINAMSNALKDGGVLFTCFKLGDKVIVDNKNRIQRYFNEETLRALFAENPELSEVKIWKTEDTLKRPDNDWINIILIKN